MNDLQAFLARNKLSKSVHADDFAAIRKETDPSGVDAVDHVPDLMAHPRTHDAAVEEYRKAISTSAPLIRSSPMHLFGVSPKNVYRVVNSTNLPHGRTFLVKPYHEGVHPKSTFWMNHPIQGWAEMTNQSLYHAAGMGDMHQRVHVSEHDMGPGFEKHPALVVNMEPDADYIENLQPWDFDPKMVEDATKIGVMDFLSNNLDRHGRNLLTRPRNSMDERGMPHSSRLIAIDHSRNFQYHAGNKGMPAMREHPVFGMIPNDPAEVERVNREGKVFDILNLYLTSPALWHINGIAMENGYRGIAQASHAFPFIANWWPTVRSRVLSAFADRLRNIKEPRMKQHLLDNFLVRAEKLDDIAARPEWYTDHRSSEDLKVPMKVWNR